LVEDLTTLRIYNCSYRGKKYQKCLVNIPMSIVNNPAFPFKDRQKLVIKIDSEKKILIFKPFEGFK